MQHQPHQHASPDSFVTSPAVDHGWRNLIPSQMGTALSREDFSIMLATRLDILFDQDPFVAFLSAGSRAALVRALASTLRAPQPMPSLRRIAERAIRTTPLSALLSEQFVAHVVDLVSVAAFPEGDPEPQAYRQHMFEAHDTQVWIGDSKHIHTEKHPECGFDVFAMGPVEA